MLVQGHRGLLAPGALVSLRLPGAEAVLAQGRADADGGFAIDVPEPAELEALEVAVATADEERSQTIARVRFPCALAGLVAVVEVGRARHCDRHGSGRLPAQRAGDPAEDAASAAPAAFVAPRVRLLFADGSVAAVDSR
jgi:hypothetical protein